MNLLFLSHSSKYTGGAQKCLVDLIKGLKIRDKDVKIYIIFPNEGDMIDICKPFIDGYKIIEMRWWLKNRRSSFFKRILLWAKIFFLNFKINKYIKEIDANYTITNTITIPFLAFASRLKRVKHVWFLHEIPNSWDSFSFVWRIEVIYKCINSLSSTILVPSLFAKSYYDRFLEPDKVKVVTQSVEVCALTNDMVKSNRYTVLLVGSFDTNKGQLELLSAVNEIVLSGKDILCYLVGDDAGYAPQCEQYVIDNNLSDNVIITSFSNSIEYFYQLTDIVVVCSGIETFGRVAVEAQLLDKPVIGSDIAVNFERINDNITGLIYKRGDIGDLVSKIEQLRDPAVRSRFAQQIKESDLSKYSAERFADSFCKLLPR